MFAGWGGTMTNAQDNASRIAQLSSAAVGATSSCKSEPLPVHDAADLLAGSNVAMIRLGAMTYTLRLTRQGKLILTK